MENLVHQDSLPRGTFFGARQLQAVEGFEISFGNNTVQEDKSTHVFWDSMRGPAKSFGIF